MNSDSTILEKKIQETIENLKAHPIKHTHSSIELSKNNVFKMSNVSSFQKSKEKLALDLKTSGETNFQKKEENFEIIPDLINVRKNEQEASQASREHTFRNREFPEKNHNKKDFKICIKHINKQSSKNNEQHTRKYQTINNPETLQITIQKHHTFSVSESERKSAQNDPKIEKSKKNLKKIRRGHRTNKSTTEAKKLLPRKKKICSVTYKENSQKRSIQEIKPSVFRSNRTLNLRQLIKKSSLKATSFLSSENDRKAKTFSHFKQKQGRQRKADRHSREHRRKMNNLYQEKMKHKHSKERKMNSESEHIVSTQKPDDVKRITFAKLKHVVYPFSTGPSRQKSLKKIKKKLNRSNSRKDGSTGKVQKAAYYFQRNEPKTKSLKIEYSRSKDSNQKKNEKREINQNTFIKKIVKFKEKSKDKKIRSKFVFAEIPSKNAVFPLNQKILNFSKQVRRVFLYFLRFWDLTYLHKFTRYKKNKP